MKNKKKNATKKSNSTVNKVKNGIEEQENVVDLQNKNLKPDNMDSKFNSNASSPKNVAPQIKEKTNFKEPLEKSKTAAELVENEEIEQHEELKAVNVLIKNSTDEKELCSAKFYRFTTIQDIKQHLIDTGLSNSNTCFNLSLEENDNKILEDYQTFDEISQIINGPKDDKLVLILSDKLYSERELFIHLIKMKDVLSGHQLASNYGVDYALSSLSSVLKSEVGDFFKNYENLVDTDFSYLSKKANYTFQEPAFKSLQASKWNPPPFHRKLKGDLMYLNLITLEGKEYDICACESGFYTFKDFDLIDSKEDMVVAHELPELIIKLSPKFFEKFTIAKDAAAKLDIYEYIPTSCGVYPWLVEKVKHQPDSSRNLFAQIQALDSTDASTFREWNDEYQTLRELPSNTPQEKVTRDQSLSKHHSDFVEAALKGVQSLVNGGLQPLNPSEPKNLHMFLQNNIFYSQGFDGREQFLELGGSEACHVSFGKDVDGVKLLANLDIPGIYTLATAVIDYRGSRIVAQSIVPGILKRDASLPEGAPVLYGSIDGGKEICSNEAFQEIAETVGRALRLEKHTVLDSKNNGHQLFTSVETKGILGTDNRKYFLDLFRATPVDICFLDKITDEKISYPHKLCLLRAELLDEFYEHKLKNYLEDNKEKYEKNSDNSFLNNFSIKFNVDCFTGAKLGGGDEVVKSQENMVKNCSIFLQDVLLKRLVDTLTTSTSHSIPIIDTNTLTRLFHRSGVNMRYLGTVLSMLNEFKDYNITLITDLIVEEMISRSCKKLLRTYLSEVSSFNYQKLLALVFNCLFAKADHCKKAAYDLNDNSLGVKVKSNDYEKNLFNTLTSATLKSDILDLVKNKYLYNLNVKNLNSVIAKRSLPLLRSICLKVGIQIYKKDYLLGKTNNEIFDENDFCNLLPLVKHSEPRVTFGYELMQHAQISISQGNTKAGMELMVECVNIFEQSYGHVHVETGRVYQQLAMQYFKIDEYKLAREHQRNCVVIFERTLGCDDPETLQQYVNLSFFEHIHGDIENSLKLLKHVFKLWNLHCCNEVHQETLSYYSTLASMSQNIKDYETAAKFWSLSKALNVKLFGKASENYFISLENESKNSILSKDYRKAIANEREILAFFEERFGKEHKLTKEVEAKVSNLLKEAVAARKESLKEEK